MNHSIRNTIILAVTLIVMLGGGWLFLHFTYASDLERLEQIVVDKEREMRDYDQTASLYNETLRELTRQHYIRDNHPKELFQNHRSGRIYDFLIRLNEGISFTNFNYSVRDSVTRNQYGIVTVLIRGEGEYRNLNNFIHRIEHSSPITLINSLQISNINELGRLSQVRFDMELQIYYNRDPNLNMRKRMNLAAHLGNIGHNPFYPLIHPVPPNERNLVDVDNSTLLGMTSRFILLRDQGGVLRRMTVGDQVYLGRLHTIDTQSQEAVFHLNRGGIFDRVRLTLD